MHITISAGDKVRNTDGTAFSNGDYAVTVEKLTENGKRAHLAEPNTYIDTQYIEKVPQAGDIVKNKSGRTFSNGNLYATVEAIKEYYGKERALLKETRKHTNIEYIEVVPTIEKVMPELFANVDKDMVNQPNHYTAGGIEVFDYLEAKLSAEALEGYFTGNVIKYISRYKHKNGVEDLKKAQVYLGKLIEKLEGEK
jgi:hypothetical protein